MLAICAGLKTLQIPETDIPRPFKATWFTKRGISLSSTATRKAPNVGHGGASQQFLP